MAVTLILHSGGLDSTVCLLLAKEQGREVLSLGIDYGQRHSIEMTYAAKLCKRLKVPRRVVRVRWRKPHRTIPTHRTVEEMRANVSPAFLPGRNALFLTLAAAEGASANADEIWIGVNSIDYSGYPDCQPAFVEAFNSMLKKGIPGGPTVFAPLQSMSKSEIASEAIRLGIKKNDTWSCYRPVRLLFRLKACGICDACVLHNAAWQVHEISQ
jgi:7-cyano-7-deazaguanine synthase